MDKTEFYNVLDISDPEEFTYYENMASLLEEDQTIEQNLIDDLLREVDFTRFRDLAKSYFEEFLNRVPDEETDLYFLADTMRRSVVGCEDPESLADAIYRFRKWYIVEPSVIDRLTLSLSPFFKNFLAVFALTCMSCSSMKVLRRTSLT